ncbi:ABC transporter permease [Clostridium weizhouense]|uniref:FtsX-like permease family protein n=1 Tax=Clostridium weizhouense TaxID=2859781 RepID=A0ABS7AK04_9CLOT|nr:FtsX-like permease family protein [Clostridium weizhouense]MBW6408761.1 FtsX-like permease family protein [Clostridium weizhouense]
MYFKLAIKNLKRSFKDYTIYFLTLIFGVCIFYSFNSIESQKLMMKISEDYENAFDLVNTVMNIVSIFISFILGFLIIYANNYLIRRRKKEFGIYMILGMESKSLSRIIFLETLLVGILSLGIGLIIGVFLSQGLSVLTAEMFNVNLIQFKFIFSISACVKTIICFGLIYLIILIFNSFSIRKVKLINLLTVAKKNETLKIRNKKRSILFFIISILMIISAYYIILSDGMAVLGKNITISFILGAVGTFLFFFSLSGLLIKLAQSNKKQYFKNLNMFVLKQINSKINTTFISMAFICLMLFLATSMLSGGLGLNKGLNENIRDLTQFDATFCNLKGQDIKKILSDKGINLNEYVDKYVSYNIYDNKFGYRDLLNKYLTEKENSYYKIYVNEDIPIMKLSEFNKIMKMLNKQPIKLEENEYIIFTDDHENKDLLEKSLQDKTKININNHNLVPSNMKVLDVVIYNDIIKHNLATIIVNDSVLEGIVPVRSFLNLNYKLDGNNIENNLNKAIDNFDNETKSDIGYKTKNQVLAQSAGIAVTLSYLSIYIGIIFLITSAAVLALQQLSECDNNIERYKLLTKIGVDENMINKSLLIQIGIYFMVPLSLAIVHSIVGIKLASQMVTILVGVGIVNNVIFTAILLVVIYGGYFISTYLGTKKMIKQYI